MESNQNGRRDFLKRLSAAGLLGVGASTVLSACGGGESGGQDAEPEAEAEASMAAEGCMDTSGLTEQEITSRTQLGYVDESPNPEELCSNCALWLPVPEGETCGGCNLIKGPIHPDGWCISYARASS